MRLVAHAAMRPHRCAVIPFVGNSNARGGFIDTGQDLPGWDPHVYVSVAAVEQMAQLIGWQPAQVTSMLKQQLAVRDERIADLEAQVADHAKFREAAEYTLGAFGAKVRGKPGRPPKQKVEA